MRPSRLVLHSASILTSHPQIISSAHRGAAVSVGPLWHECLGRLLVHAACLARSVGSSALAPPLLLQHLSTLRLLVEDPKSADFAAGTDVARLRGKAGTQAGDAPDASAALNGGAGGTALHPPRSVAAAILELCADVLHRGGAAPGDADAQIDGGSVPPAGGASSSSSTVVIATSACDAAAAEGLACYLAHRLLHAHGARGGTPLPLRGGWAALWRGTAASVRRCARPGALQRPRVARLAAQLLNLLAFGVAGGAHLAGPAPEHSKALTDAILLIRPDVLRLGEAARQAGLLDPADATSLAPPDAIPWLGDATHDDASHDKTDPDAAQVAFRPAPRASAASLPAAALPPLRLRPLLDVFAAAEDARCRGGGSTGRHVAAVPALPRVTLERLDAAFAAGGAPSQAALAAQSALSRALVQAAAPDAAALLAATGALDAQLSGARHAAGAAQP